MTNDWEGIDEFVAVAECGGFTRAAERLGASSSHVSRSIMRLEDRLQSRLFYRSTRTVTLTEAGRLLLAHCQRLVEERREAFRQITDASEEPAGSLRMTCAIAYGERFIVPLVNQFLEQHPRLEVQLDLTNVAVDLVHEGYDLAIRLGRLAPSSLTAVRLAPRQMYLCAAPAYLDRHGTPRDLSELAAHNCLVGTSDLWVFQRDGGEWVFRARGRWRCNSGPAVLDAALRGFGICHLPDYYVTEHLATGRLVSLLPEHQPPGTGVWAVQPQRRHQPAKVRLMVQHLRAGLRTSYAPEATPAAAAAAAVSAPA